VHEHENENENEYENENENEQLTVLGPARSSAPRTIRTSVAANALFFFQ
jgi:hypothetical protein